LFTGIVDAYAIVKKFDNNCFTGSAELQFGIFPMILCCAELEFSDPGGKISNFI